PPMDRRTREAGQCRRLGRPRVGRLGVQPRHGGPATGRCAGRSRLPVGRLRITEIMGEAGLVDVRWRGQPRGIVTFPVGAVPRGRAPDILRAVPSPLTRAADAVAPSRLGRGFRWLLAASTITNVGDGVALAAGPLLVASQTRDPFLVSLALFMEYLPVLLFGLIGGGAAGRFDPRRGVIIAHPRPPCVLPGLVAAHLTRTGGLAAPLLSLL